MSANESKDVDHNLKRIYQLVPLVMRSWAADAFFCELALPGTSSFFCCFREKSLIMVTTSVFRESNEYYISRFKQ